MPKTNGQRMNDIVKAEKGKGEVVPTRRIIGNLKSPNHRVSASSRIFSLPNHPVSASTKKILNAFKLRLNQARNQARENEKYKLTLNNALELEKAAENLVKQVKKNYTKKHGRSPPIGQSPITSRNRSINRYKTRGGSRKKSRKVLCYTGIDSNKTGVHTPEEFLKIAKNKWSKNKDFCNHINTGKYVCPKLDDLDGWMKWVGSAWMDDELQCRKSAKSVQDDLMKFYKDRLGNIKSGKYQNSFRNTALSKSDIRRMTVKSKKMAENGIRKLEK